MRKLLKRALGAAAITGLSLGFVPLMAGTAGAAPGLQPDPGISPNPVPTSTSSFSLTVPTGTTCDGTGAEGWRIHTFIVDSGVDISTLDFTGVSSGVPGYVGLDQDLSDGSASFPLAQIDGDAGVAFLPANSPAGLINPTNLSGFNFDPGNGWTLGDGSFQVGFVCTSPGNVLSQWWVQDVTIDADASSGSFMVEGVAPDAPTITNVVPDSAECTVSFASGSPEPGDSFRVEATDGSTVASATGSTSPITVTGLLNGTTYDITVYAITPAGETISTNTVQCVPQTNGGPVVNLALTNAVDGAGNPVVNVDWEPPATDPSCTVVNYVITTTGGGAVSSPTTATDAVVTGVSPGDQVQVTVTPNFGAACFGQGTSVSTIVPADVVIYQDIDVTRPIGALVLTQICGANAAIPGESAIPGFPDGLPLIEEQFPSSVGNPVLAGGSVTSAPTLTEDGADGDPNVPEYPYPTDDNGVEDSVPTHCGVNLGIAEFVTVGPGSGQYFAAQGEMSQVTIVDTRNVDAGWFVTGTVTDFSAAGQLENDGSGFSDPATDSFGGDQLGWIPQMTEDTGVFTYELAGGGTATYDQTVAAGPAVRPNTGQDTADDGNFDPDTGVTVDGLTNGETLAYADEGEGLGTAILDGRLMVLIPISADAGLYEATLNITAV